jgi:hypothetical protein
MASLAVPAPSAMTCDTAMFRMITLREPFIDSSIPCRCASLPTPSSVLLDFTSTLSAPMIRPETVTTYGFGLPRYIFSSSSVDAVTVGPSEPPCRRYGVPASSWIAA